MGHDQQVHGRRSGTARLLHTGAWGLGAAAVFLPFTERLGLPLVPCGLGHGLAEIEKGYVDLLYALAC